MKKISWFPATDIFVVQIGNDGQVLFDTSYSFRTVNFGKSIQKAGDVLIVAGYAGCMSLWKEKESRWCLPLIRGAGSYGKRNTG